MRIIKHLNDKFPFLNNAAVVTFICIITSCIFTLINGYPILYSDTSTYIISGFELEAPFDRPIIYGILLRIFSFNGLTFFLIPFFQSWLFIYVIFRTLKLFLQKQNVSIEVFFLSILLTLFTGFNWSVNQLIPDFIAGLGLLSLICLLFDNNTLKYNLPLLFVFFIATSSHISHLFLYLFLFVIILLARKKFLLDRDRRLFRIKALCVSFIFAVSYLIMGSAISKSKNVMFAGSLAQKGILEVLLKDKCDEKNFLLCKYKDSIPKSFEKFVWKPESPLYQCGGWKALHKELGQIKSISLSESKYLKMQVSSTAKGFFKQLVLFDIGDGNGSFKEETPLIQRIQRFSILDDAICISSAQYKGTLSEIYVLNTVYTVFTALSFLILLYLIFTKHRYIPGPLRLLILLSLLLIIVSAGLIAFSSEITSRHGCKLAWLVVLLDFLILAGFRNTQNPNPESKFF